jgi:hypothetical protein
VIGAARRHLPGVDVTILERAGGGRGQARPFPARVGPYAGGQWHRQRDRIVLAGI